jgi:hypothetical protein
VNKKGRKIGIVMLVTFRANHALTKSVTELGALYGTVPGREIGSEFAEKLTSPVRA